MSDRPKLLASLVYATPDHLGRAGHADVCVQGDPDALVPATITIEAGLLGSSGKHEVVAEIVGPNGSVVGRNTDWQGERPGSDVQWGFRMTVVFVPRQMGTHHLFLMVDGARLARHRIEVVAPPSPGLTP